MERRAVSIGTPRYNKALVDFFINKNATTNFIKIGGYDFISGYLSIILILRENIIQKISSSILRTTNAKKSNTLLKRENKVKYGNK